MITRTQPFPIRLMSLVVYLPILLTLFVFNYLIGSTERPELQYEFVWGISCYHWKIIVMVIIPILAGLLLLWRGTIRFSLILMLAPAFLTIPVGSVVLHKVYLAPEKRVISFNLSASIPTGTEVYCNGVMIGQTPFDITVEELLQKVEPWTAPPDQKWHGNKSPNLYSWLPWDGFIRDRHERQDTARLDECQYWWRMEFEGAELCFIDFDTHVNRNFDEIARYYVVAGQKRFAPSLRPHADILLSVYSTLNADEKNIWAAYALKNFDLIGPSLLLRKNSDPEIKEAMKAVARLHYGLSEKPTQEECRKALEKIVQEHVDVESYESRSSNTARFGSNVSITGFTKAATLGPIAVEQMGDAAIGPLKELIRKYRYDTVRFDAGKIDPLLYAARVLNHPELFDELVQHFAVAYKDSSAVWKNENERVAPLFRTVLRGAAFQDALYLGVDGKGEVWYIKLEEALHYYNSITEPVLRQEIERMLPDLKEPYLTISLKYYMLSRWNLPGIDREEMQNWVKPLLPRTSYTRMDQLISDTQMSDLNYPHLKGRIGWLLKHSNGLIKSTEFKNVKNFVENSGQKPVDYFAIIDNDTAKSTSLFMIQSLFFKEYFEDSDESADFLRKLWEDADMKKDIRTALQRQFVEEIRIQPWVGTKEGRNGQREQTFEAGADVSYAQNEARAKSQLRIPGLYGNYGVNGDSVYTFQFSPALYPIFLELSDMEQEELCIRIARELSSQEAPEAIDVIRKWCQSENPRVKTAASETLVGLELRDKIKAESKSLFLDLAGGKIKPDDLLPATNPWVWKDGKYVQEQ